jgi:uncharacterized protein
LAAEDGKNRFTGHGEGYVAVNGQRYEQSLAITANAVYDTWRVNGFAELGEAHLAYLLELKPEIVILGTGASQRFPPPLLLRDFAAAQIGIEVMATPAACRTYNILLAEGRAVLAAVLIV